MKEPNTRPLLILDLDETLIHGAEAQLHRPADLRIGPFHVYHRPHLATFLTSVSQWYDLALWSSASGDYVDAIAASLVTHGAGWRFVWSRSRCIQRMDPEKLETHFIKDLRKVERLGYCLHRILAVDDTRQKLSRNYGNAIYIPPYEGSDTDRELPRLAAFLRFLHDAPDFRTIEKRGWRMRTFAQAPPAAMPPGSDEERINPSAAPGAS